jgi:hypothetical protein
MNRDRRVLLLLLGGILLTSQTLLGQRGFLRAGPPAASARFVFGPTLPQFGGYGFGEYGNLSLGYSWNAAPYVAAPQYWWVSPYSIGDSRQDGYNPDAGYEWDSVGALLLTTFPVKAQVTLDGTCVGTADKLGPFQLPVGEYRLRVEAVGYQPSETVVRFDKPGVRELNIELKPLAATAKAARLN